MQFYQPFRWLPIAICSLLFGALEALALFPLMEFANAILWVKVVVDAFIMAGLGLVLFTVIRSWNYVEFDFWQRVVNYSALGVIYLIIWGLLNYLLVIFTAREGGPYERLLKLLPLTLFIAFLIYIIQLLLIHDQIRRENHEPDTASSDVDEPALPVIENQLVVPEGESENVEEVLERVAVKSGQKIHVILVPDIIYIQSDGDYVQIVTAEGRHLKEERMKFFEANLPCNNFVRVHRSYIVNVEKILRIELYEKQNQMLTLSNGDQIKASVSGYRSLRAVLNL